MLLNGLGDSGGPDNRLFQRLSLLNRRDRRRQRRRLHVARRLQFARPELLQLGEDVFVDGLVQEGLPDAVDDVVDHRHVQVARRRHCQDFFELGGCFEVARSKKKHKTRFEKTKKYKKVKI